MLLSPSSPSPSSSAVTLPRPGKSILKKPPPPQQSFFSLSRLSRLLPSQNPPSSSSSSTAASSSTTGSDENLKRAHFYLPHLVTVYPISATNPPCTVTTKEEKKSIEAREAERRRRIVRGNSLGPGETEDWWSTDKVESFYHECCVGREEQPHSGISAALKVSCVIDHKDHVADLMSDIEGDRKERPCTRSLGCANHTWTSSDALRRVFSGMGSSEVISEGVRFGRTCQQNIVCSVTILS